MRSGKTGIVQTEPVVTPETEVQGITSDSEQEPTIFTASFVAVGDNLIHDTIYQQASERLSENGYNFAPAYEKIVPFINFTDFAFINQETLILPPPYEPSSYPRFSTPREAGDFLVRSGFNMFSIANNHSLDKGEKALADSIEFWRTQNGIIFSGAFTNTKDRDTVRIIEKNGIKVALIAATDTLNGLSLESNSSLHILLISDETLLEQMICAAKAQSDIVVVSVHWGSEYIIAPTKAQKTLAQKLADWGTDIIIGTHPHVLQPVEELTAADGRKTLVTYSLGNFISAQNEGMRLIGAMLSLELEKNAKTGVTLYKNVAVTPLITHYEKNFKNITVYPIELYSPELARNHGVRKYTSRFNYNYIVNNTKKIIDGKYLSLPQSILKQMNTMYEIWIMR